MDEKHPCDLCEAKKRASGCNFCIFDNRYSTYYGVTDCIYNYEGDCTLGCSDECKCSDNYEDDLYTHDCSECVRFTEKTDEDGVPYYTCGEDGAQIGEYDSPCDKFEEREEK